MAVYLHTVGNNLPLASAKKSQTADAKANAAPGEMVANEESSKASLKMNSLVDLVAAAPEMSEEKISRVVNALQAGHYEFNPQKAAEKMLELELQLP